jgi:hypothetical protein
MKIIFLDGGLGRIISTIPALLKYHKNNPNREWYISIYNWDYVTLGIPELQDRTFDPNTKGIWESVIMRADETIAPEPYRLPNYYKGKISLAEAFDEILNETEDHSDLEYETLKLSHAEIRSGQEIIYSAYEERKKQKTIVINPYGSTSQKSILGVFDDTLRSIPEEMFIHLSRLLSNEYNVIYMGRFDLLTNDNKFVFCPKPDPHIRQWMGVISQVDYFVGCDTAGQHIARAFGTRGCVVMGGTDPNNVSYPDHFKIIKRKNAAYSPMRISQLQSNIAERMNKECIDYTLDEIYEIYEQIKKDIEKI